MDPMRDLAIHRSEGGEGIPMREAICALLLYSTFSVA